MATNLIGDARRRKQLELSQQYWRCYQLSGERDGLLAAIDRIRASHSSAFDKNLQICGARERLRHVVSDLTMARVRAENAASALGEDANVAQFFAVPKPRGGAVRLNAPIAPARRGAVSIAPARRTLPTGMLIRMLGGPGCR